MPLRESQGLTARLTTLTRSCLFLVLLSENGCTDLCGNLENFGVYYMKGCVVNFRKTFLTSLCVAPCCAAGRKGVHSSCLALSGVSLACRGRVGLFSSQLRVRIEYSTEVLPGKPGPELSGTPGKPSNSGHPGPGRPARTPSDRPGRIPGRVPGPGKTPGRARLPGLGRGRLRATPGARGSAGLCPGKPGQPGHRPGKPGKPGKQQETLADNFRSGLPPHKRTGSQLEP